MVAVRASTHVLREPNTESRSARAQLFRNELIVGVAAIVCFLNVLPNDFTLDDCFLVRDNPLVNEAGHWADLWTADLWSSTGYIGASRDLLYRPMTVATYRLMRCLFGADPLPHLILNILLHALICVTLVRLVRRLRGGESAALAAGLLFAVLPIHTEVVAGVVGRADLLATLGTILALLAHRHFMRAPTAHTGVVWRGVTSAIVFLTVCSKENGVAVFPLLCVFDLYWQREIKASGRPRARSTMWGRLAPLGVVLLIYVALRYNALGGRLFGSAATSKTANLLVDAPPWQHALGVVQLWGMYWAKTLWPAVLSIKYSINAIRPATSVLDPDVVAGVAAATMLLLVSITQWRDGRRSFALLTAALVISYAPTANAFMLIGVYFAERIWYLPSVFVCILVGLGIAPWLSRSSLRGAAALLLVAMTARCWVRSADWRDNGTLFTRAYRDQPNAVGPLQLYGDWLVNRTPSPRGIELLRRALAIDPGFIDARVSLGRALLAAGAYAEAVRTLQIAVMQDPHHAGAEAALAESTSRLEAAGDDTIATTATRANATPDDPSARIAAIEALRDAGKIDDALAELARYDARFADDDRWHAAYAVTLALAGRFDEAIERYRRCVALDRTNVQAGVELAMMLLDRRHSADIDEAERLCERAVERAPRAPDVLACRAEVSVARGDIGAAIELYRMAVGALPPGSRQRGMFEQRMASLGR